MQHGQWRRPASFHAAARPALRTATRSAPTTAVVPAPKVTVDRDGGHAVLDYRFKKPTRGQVPPVGLVVSIDAPDDELPPATYNFPVTGLEGSIEHPLELETRPYVVRVTAFSQAGDTGDDVTLRLGS